jgi:hypothetical protein
MNILEHIRLANEQLSLPEPEDEIYVDLNQVPEDETPESDGDNAELRDSGGRAAGSDPGTRSLSGLKAKPPSRKVIPFVRPLQLGARGNDVVAIKRALKRAGARTYKLNSPIFGAILRRDLKRFQKKNGLPVTGKYNKATHLALVKYFDNYGVWLLLHTPKPKNHTKVEDMRQHIVAAAVLGYNNRYSIHYTQGPSRMQGVKQHIRPPRFPHWEDCSSFATWCYWVSGAPDPNGLHYNGFGYTGTMANHGTWTSNPQAGDLALYGYNFPYHHVTVYIGGGRCISHGGEDGPLLLSVHYRNDLHQYRTYI